jgi:hypothetical protein
MRGCGWLKINFIMKKSAHQIWKESKEQNLTKEEFKEKLKIEGVIVKKLEVAVLCPSFRDYKIWLKENEKTNENYTWVYSINCVRGKLFDRVEKIFRYYNIQDINGVLDYLETHLRSNPA